MNDLAALTLQTVIPAPSDFKVAPVLVNAFALTYVPPEYGPPVLNPMSLATSLCFTNGFSLIE